MRESGLFLTAYQCLKWMSHKHFCGFFRDPSHWGLLTFSSLDVAARRNPVILFQPLFERLTASSHTYLIAAKTTLTPALSHMWPTLGSKETHTSSANILTATRIWLPSAARSVAAPPLSSSAFPKLKAAAFLLSPLRAKEEIKL